MRMRALAARVLAVVVAASSLVAVSSVAQAAPAPCTITFSSGSSGAIPPKVGTDPFGFTFFDIAVPDGRTVADVDFFMDVSAPEAAQIGFRLISPEAVAAGTLEPYSIVQAPSSGPLSAGYTFDDEATAVWGGASPPSGRYQPSTPLTPLEGKPAAGTWRLNIANSNTSPGTLRSFSVTLTFTTCDTDGDGAADGADNCPGPNPDQSNLDGDALGDACDGDIDGDDVLNAGDGCPTVVGSTPSGCPPAGRTATLRHRAKKHRLVATVASPVAGCRSEAEVTVWRKKKGRDARIVLASTNRAGKVAVKAPRRAGRYYVTVASSYAAGQAECGAAKSRSVRVKRR